MPIPKVSIIIPVYRVEKYIERCVRTLFAQTLDDLEYIFVDDCSPDNSIDVMLHVLDEYPNRKPQVKLIRHEINQGVSQSRQDGINTARGEYIIHCDPDDWVELDIYEQLYTKAKETDADVVTSDFTYENGSKSTLKNQKPNELTGISILKSISGVNCNNIHGALWNKLIKSDKCKEISFPKDIHYCEDVSFLFKLLTNKNLKITYINKSLYHYFNNDKSIVNVINEKAIENDRNLIKLILNLKSESPEIDECLKSFSIATVYNRAFLYGDMSDYQFKFYYCDYIPFVKYNKQIKLIDKILLRLAGQGHYKAAKTIRKNMSVLKRMISNKS